MSLLLLFNPNRSGGGWLGRRVMEGWGMIEIARDETAPYRRAFPVLLVDPIDGVTPVTGQAGGRPQLSADGLPWTDAANTLAEVGQGSYVLTLTPAELARTGGILGIRYKSVATAEFVAWARVI